MNDLHEQEIDRVLRALGAATPSAALEDRVLARLAQPVVPLRFRWAWPVFATVVCALVAMFFAFTGSHRRAVAPATAVVSSARAPMVFPSADLTATVRKRSYRHTSAEKAVPPLQAERTNRGLADLPSLFAPAAPVTAQEHQLARIARGTDRQDLALLNPAERERLAEQSAAEFKEFFPPPTPQEIYLATHTNN